MARRLGWLVVVVLLAAVGFAGAPDDFKVQGNYEGTWIDDTATTGKAEAMVIAQGKGRFKMLLTRHVGDKKDKPVELAGQTSDGKVVFAGGDWTAEHLDAAIKGRHTKAEKLSVTLERVVKKSPTLGAEPPEGAIVLFDGKSLGKWLGRRNQPPRWKILGDGAAQVQGGTIRTKERFGGSFKYHIEFKTAFRPEKWSQGRGNSGVFLPNGEEIQVLDSFGNKTYKGGGCGGIYKYKDPDVFASLPPGEWQTFDIEHVLEKKDGKPTGKVVVTVYHNGIKIHDNFPLRRGPRKGTLRLQDHGNPVQYRNIWLLPIQEK